jgi:hypothetical protein
MTICNGSPAELQALRYVEGTLSAAETEKFEEHYFDCPVCLAHLQAIQAVEQELARNPVATLPMPEPASKVLLRWPAWVWTVGAVAAVLVVSVLTYKDLESRPAQPMLTQSTPKSPSQMRVTAQPLKQPATLVHLSQLADLTLPVFTPPNLRGENLDTHFEAGMKEYASGNCRGAIAALAQVPAESAEARAATFYSGACQMHLGNFTSASQFLRKVADAGDSPQQEAAVYGLAQMAVAGNDPAAARKYLQRTIALRGDLEQRAREQDRRIAELTGQNKAAAGKNPAAK